MSPTLRSDVGTTKTSHFYQIGGRRDQFNSSLKAQPRFFELSFPSAQEDESSGCAYFSRNQALQKKVEPKLCKYPDNNAVVTERSYPSVRSLIALTVPL
jgi:hypothetical protein